MTDRGAVDRIARAVLYEGYALYPYRPSSLKNARRIAFGTLCPPAAAGGSDRCAFQAECLVDGGRQARITVAARFLQQTGGETIEREAVLESSIGDLSGGGVRPFGFPDVEGEIAVRVFAAGRGVCRLSVAVRNTGAGASMLAAHAALAVSDGAFVSMTDPPAALADAAAECRNEGVWPVLVGAPGARDAMLASPIILPDYPQIAPESAGDLYDGTEIEEILTLRILTLTDEEKAEARASEARVREILERAEALPPERLMRLHGSIRGLAPPRAVRARGVEVKAGDRVRLRPRGRADIFDSILDGRTAVVEAIEQSLEGDLHVAVVIEDDPGRDLGEARQIGHRFFFSAGEIEPLDTDKEHQ